MNPRSILNSDPDILGGQPVFTGTRVPIETLFDHLEAGISLNEFLLDFPGVTKEQAVGLLDLVSKLITTKNVDNIYEAFA